MADDKTQIDSQQIVVTGPFIDRNGLLPASVTYDGSVYLDPSLGPFLPTDPANKAYVDASIPQETTGMVRLYHGSLSDAAAGWGACDGKWYDPSYGLPGQTGIAAADSTHTVQTCTLADPVSGVHYIEKL